MEALPAIPPEAVRRMGKRELADLLRLLDAYDAADAQERYRHLFPDRTHDWRGATYHERGRYPRHLELMEAGATHRERCFMAANRVGKTLLGAYETALHLTGLYPEWWAGARFDRPTQCWAAGKTNETTRDIVQAELLGPIRWQDGRRAFAGTGMIPGRCIGQVSWRQGVTDLVDTVRVRHVSGGESLLGVKSYQQGRGSFEGTAKHFVWLDEEPPLEVYSECLTRTMTTNGRVLLTFTPLDGVTATVASFMAEEPDA